MRIAVIGAGSMGGVFGGRLTAAGNDVWLVDVWQAHVDAMNRDGLRLEAPDGSRVIPVRATSDVAKVGVADLVIVFVKSYDTPAAARSALPLVGENTVLLTMQNGLGNRDAIAAVVGEERVVSGVSYVGAALAGPGHVRQTSSNVSLLGEMDAGPTPRVQRIAGLLEEAGFPVRLTDNLRGEIWGKLLVNCVGNASCALTGLTGLGLIQFPSGREWVRLVAEETAAVAQALGIRLPYPDATEKMFQNCEVAGPAKPSMLQDVEHGRWTEIDYINGAVVREGGRAGVPTPYNRALTLLVRMLESRQHGLEPDRPPL